MSWVWYGCCSSTPCVLLRLSGIAAHVGLPHCNILCSQCGLFPHESHPAVTDAWQAGVSASVAFLFLTHKPARRQGVVCVKMIEEAMACTVSLLTPCGGSVSLHLFYVLLSLVCCLLPLCTSQTASVVCWSARPAALDLSGAAAVLTHTHTHTVKKALYVSAASTM